MNRNMFRRRPEFESMESIFLLSAVSITGRSGVADVAESEAMRHSIMLSGTVRGTYSLRGRPGSAETVSARGSIAPLGKVTLRGSIPLTSPNGGGSVTISTRQGTVFAKLSENGIGSPLFYTITRGTGKLAGVSGTGEAVITIVPTKRGKPDRGTLTITFTTAAAAVVPTVSSETPASNATDVAITSAVTATFNETVQPVTIGFTLTSSSGSAVAGTVGYNSSTKIATFTPTAALAYGTVYTATVSGAKDGAGDPMSGPVTWTFTTEPVTGTTYWVSSSGSDSNSGSEASPWLTLQSAVNKLTAGDTLNVLAGTYAGFSVGYSTPVLAGTSTGPITVQAAPGTAPGSVIIDSQNPDRACAIDLEPGCNYWTISGFSVINSNSQFTAEGLYITSSHVNILHCIITGDDNDMNYCILTSGSYLTIQDNTCSEATGTDLYGHGIYCGNSTEGINITNINLIGNTIYSCSEHGLQVNGDDTGIEAATNCIIEGNTIYNITAGSGMNLDAVQNSTISNNLIYNYTVYGIALFSDSTQYATNDIIVNNTIYHGTTGNYAALAIGEGTDADIDNTVLNNVLLGAGSYGCAIIVNSESISGLVSNYNVVGTTSALATFSVNSDISSESWASWKSGTGQDANSIVVSLSSLFVNDSSNNFQEAAGSLSIGAGTSTDAPSTDILGNPRPSSYGYDIGCYEYEPSSSDSMVVSKSLVTGATKLAVSSPVTALGTPQLSPLTSTIQTITVTSDAPVWEIGRGRRRHDLCARPIESQSDIGMGKWWQWLRSSRPEIRRARTSCGRLSKTPQTSSRRASISW